MVVVKTVEYIKTSKIQNPIFRNTVKPVVSGHSKIDKTKILMINGSLMMVKVLLNAPLGAFCNTFNLHYAISGLETNFGLFR